VGRRWEGARAGDGEAVRWGVGRWGGWVGGMRWAAGWPGGCLGEASERAGGARRRAVAVAVADLRMPIAWLW
jgi:hypothetical protein